MIKFFWNLTLNFILIDLMFWSRFWSVFFF